MPNIVTVPGLGRVRFPDSMSQEDIDKVIESKPWEQQQQAAPTPPQATIQPPQSLFAPAGTHTMLPPPNPYGPGGEYGQTIPFTLGGDPQKFVDEQDPFAPLGRAMTQTGRGLVGGLADVWEQVREQMNPAGLPSLAPGGGLDQTQLMQERQLERDLPGYIQPPSNLAALSAGEEMPAVAQGKFLDPAARGMLAASQGFIESTPRLALMSAMTAGGVPTWMAGGVSFGATETGLDPKAAVIGAALPAAGHWSGEAAGLLAEKAGMTSVAALNFVRGVSAAGVPAAGLLAEQWHEINGMQANGLLTPEEAKDQKVNALFSAGYNLGLGPMGARFERDVPKPPVIPGRRTQNMLREVPGSERLSDYERAVLDAEREGIDAPIKVVSDVDLSTANPDDPFATAKPRQRQQTGVFMRANKSTGEIEIYPGELQDWLNGVPENRRSEAMRRRLNEEEIHLSTPGEAAANYWESLGDLTRLVVSRVYVGNYRGLDPVSRQPLTPAELGYEAVRLKLQQLDRQGPAEVAEAALRERWTVKSLLALDNIVDTAMQAASGNPKARGQREILDRVSRNIAVAKRTVETGKAPAARRKQQAEQQRLPYDERTKQYFNLMRQAQDDPNVVREAQQMEFDQKATTEPAPAIGEATFGPTFRNKPGQGLLDLGPAARNKSQRDFQNDAEEFAHDMKVADPEVFALQLGRHLAGERTESPEQQSLFREFVARYPEYSRMAGPAARNKRSMTYELPENGEDINRKVESFFSHVKAMEQEGASKQDILKEYGRMDFYLEFVADKYMSMSREAVGEDQSKYYNEASNRLAEFKKMLSDGAAQVYRTGEDSFPAARNKKVPKELQESMDFGQFGTGKTPDLTASESGPKWAPISPQILEQSVGEHILSNPDPSFRAFAKMASDKWGMQPSQLKQTWQGKVWDTLMKATGRQLTELVFRLDLGSKLKMRKNLEKMRQASATSSNEAIRNAPSLSSGENVVIAKKMYGQIPDSPFIEDMRTELLKKLESGELTGTKPPPKVKEQFVPTLQPAEKPKELVTGSLFPGEDLRSAKAVSAEEAALKAQIIKDLESGKFPEGISKSTRKSLNDAIKRAETAKLREESYNKWLAEAKDLREQLRGLGFTNIDARGRPTGGGVPNRGGKVIGLRLLRARIEMDKLADPDYGTRAEERATLRKQRVRETIFADDIIPTVEGPVKVKSNRIIGTKAYTKQESGKVKTPTDEEMAQPAFNPALPSRSGSVQSRSGQLRRLRAISEIGSRLLQQEESQSESRLTREVTPDDVAYHRGDEAVRRLTPEEQANPNVVGAIITSAPAPDRATRTSKAVGGEKVTGSRSRAGEKDTRNAVAIEDVHNGRVYLVSAYEGGDGVVRVFDPASAGMKRSHEPMSPAFLRRYRPLWHLQLDEPVRDLFQRFENKDQFRREFIAETRGRFQDIENNRQIQNLDQPSKVDEARQKLAGRMELGVTDPEVFQTLDDKLRQQGRELGIPAVRPISDYSTKPGLTEQSLGNPNITEQEAGSLYAALKLWKHEDPAKVVAELEALKKAAGERGEFETQAEQEKRSKARIAMIALSKVMRQLKTENMSPEQVVTALMKLGDNRDNFVQTMLEEFSKPEIPHSLEKMAQPTQGLEPNPQELAMKSPAEVERANRMRREQGLKEFPVKPGSEYGGQPASPEPYAPKMLTPEEQAHVNTLRYSDPSFNSPAARNKAVQVATESVNFSLHNPTAGFLRYYSGWMSPRLREAGGQRANEFANRADTIIDRTKGYLGSLATRFFDRALDEVGKPGPAGTWLNGIIEQTGFGEGTAMSRAQGVVEGTIAVPAHATRAANASQRANLGAGVLIQSVVPGFVANGGFERHYTAFGYDTLVSGQGPEYQSFVRGEAWANRMSFGDSTMTEQQRYQIAKNHLVTNLSEWREQVLAPTPDMAVLDRVNQDFRRSFPNAITHVKVTGRGIFNGWREIRHGNMFNYLKATQNRAAHIRAFRDEFPVGSLTQDAYNQLRHDVATEFKLQWDPKTMSTPDIISNLDALTKTLQGHPSDQYGRFSSNAPQALFKPGSFLSDSARFLNSTVNNLLAKLILSKQIITQSGELLSGSTPRYLGLGNYARAAEMMLQDMAKNHQVYAEMERTGAVNRVHYDWSFDPQAKTRSLFRIAGNTISTFFMEQAFNEAQETMAAATARVVAQRIESGTLSKWEKRQLPNTFKAMHFTPQEVRLAMSGDAEVLAMFQRRAAAFLTAGNKHVGEGSRLGANRMFNSIFRFQQYPMMKANQLRQDYINFVGATPGTGQRKVAAEALARNLVFNTMQGGITAAVAAMFGGSMAWDIKKHEAADQKLKFLMESYFGAQSGPLYLLWRNASSNGLGNWGEQVARMAWPYATFTELLDMANGAGPYANQNLNERFGTFMQNRTPGLEPIKLGISVSGLSNYNPHYRQARSAYYRWATQVKGKPGTPSEGDAMTQEFRKHMRSAQGALISGDDAAYLNAIMAATDVKKEKGGKTEAEAKKAAAQSLRGRMLNIEKLSLQDQSALMNRIGEKAYNTLVQYDRMFDSAAKSVAR